MLVRVDAWSFFLDVADSLFHALAFADKIRRYKGGRSSVAALAMDIAFDLSPHQLFDKGNSYLQLLQARRGMVLRRQPEIIIDAYRLVKVLQFEVDIGMDAF